MSKKGRSFVKSEKAARGKNGKIAAAGYGTSFHRRPCSGLRLEHD